MPHRVSPHTQFINGGLRPIRHVPMILLRAPMGRDREHMTDRPSKIYFSMTSFVPEEVLRLGSCGFSPSVKTCLLFGSLHEWWCSLEMKSNGSAISLSRSFANWLCRCGELFLLELPHQAMKFQSDDVAFQAHSLKSPIRAVGFNVEWCCFTYLPVTTKMNASH